jgi:hypothetical protein
VAPDVFYLLFSAEHGADPNQSYQRFTKPGTYKTGLIKSNKREFQT